LTVPTAGIVWDIPQWMVHGVSCLIAAFAFLGCRRDGPRSSGGPNPLVAKTEAGTFSPVSTGDALPYRLFKPEVIRGKIPLIVYLHATPGRGRDNVSQLGPEMEVLVSERVQAAGPAFVLAPQCPSRDKWANRFASPPLQPYDLYALPESTPSRLTVALVSDLIGRYPIDPHRIYLMGFSMGGSGTWDMLMRHPDLFAAGVPISGVSDIRRANLLASMPIWSFHGELDNVSPPENGRMMFEALRKQGAPVRYTEFKGVGHGSVGPALDDPELFPWLFAQRRPDTIR
jgi:predicted peptidase